jgi:hypothetical protein
VQTVFTRYPSHIHSSYTSLERETMDDELFEIYLRKSSKVIVLPEGEALPENRAVVATIMKNVENLGFGFSEQLFNRLLTLSTESLEKFYQQLIGALRKQVGAHRLFKPMYPNFPQQVMEASELELYLNAIVHYWSDGKLLPQYEKKERLPLSEAAPKPLKVIGLGTYEDFQTIFTQLMGANSSISEEDKQVIKIFVRRYREGVVKLLPERIPQKEQLATFVGHYIREVNDITPVAQRLKTATDVLRVAVAMNNGDVSLATSTKFKHFKRAERKALLSALEGMTVNVVIEDMLRWKERWIRLGEALHPGDYRNRFPKVVRAFSVICNDEKFATTNSTVEAYLKKGDVKLAAAFLKDRPGDLARRLDHMMRLNPMVAPHIAETFASVADKVSTPVLLQLNHHLNNKTYDVKRPRVFFPKGSLAKMWVEQPTQSNPTPNTLAGNVTALAGICDALLQRFAKLPPLGKVYVDPKLVNYVVPFSERSASKALRTLVRGSRIDLPEGNTIRFFLWWKDGKGRTDIDLSMVRAGDLFDNQGSINYFNLKESGCYHSGDIVSAPNGACEFIDVNIKALTESGTRYAVMCVNSFTTQPFKDLPECFAGWMMRQKPKSGEVFEPKTVMDKVDLAGDTTINVPVVIDLVKRQIIWTDLALKSYPRLANNVHVNKTGLSLLLQGIVGDEQAKPIRPVLPACVCAGRVGYEQSGSGYGVLRT